MIGQKQIDEYNILIARFMGARDSGKTRLIDDIKHPLIVYYGNSGAMSCYVEIPGLIHKVYDVSSLQFNLFWDDWLIEVVERIESLTSNSGGHWGVHINSNSCAIQDTKFRPDKTEESYWYFDEVTSLTKLLATWECVIRFIKYYNTNIKPKEVAAITKQQKAA